MSKEKISVSGERAAIAGYLPQFDEFAWFVYRNLINDQLEWIKIADPEAKKLDDIQYSTQLEIHAYQIKWTISGDTISFSDFCKLIPLLTSSWKALKSKYPTKKIIPHLITNRQPSNYDNIKDGNEKIGSFNNFVEQVWNKIRIGREIETKWKPIIREFRKISQLNDLEFSEFIECFDFQFSYKPKEFKVRNFKHSREESDLIALSRFLFEEAGGEQRNVKFTRLEIIDELGWNDQFKTTFNHDLLIDRQTYQPIQSTIDSLNLKIENLENGYIFLVGGPGTGKSSLLSYWSKTRTERVIKYYAFDFQSPSSRHNYWERGETVSLFFDLVFQLKEEGFYKRNILPHKDIIFLKEVFFEQLKDASYQFKNEGIKTIIIIDGLDHIPREYNNVKHSFLTELLSPSDIPEGIFIILGSQSYDLEDIRLEIRKEFLDGNRTIRIEPLKKKDVYKYIDSSGLNPQLSRQQKQNVFEKSQGHPLYLSYLIERIRESNEIDSTINTFIEFEGDIENYYQKLWKPVQENLELINLLGLIARVNGSINPLFVNEWDFKESILKFFKENARFLFNQSRYEWTFFHNSFRQFLIHNTALNYLTDEFSDQKDKKYHEQLAEYYRKSNFEPVWKQNIHLFQAGKYDEFVDIVTPESFTDQLLEYRPVEDIRQDAKLGVEIARRSKNVYILIKYIFALSELERRLYNLDPASFTEELLVFGKNIIAKKYLRTESTLHCDKSYALKAARLFIKYNDKVEGAILFNQAYPDEISETGIVLTTAHRYDEIRKTLEEWVYTAPHFIDTEKILSKIANVRFLPKSKHERFPENESNLCLELLIELGYSLIQLGKWNDLDMTIKSLDLNKPDIKSRLFFVFEEAIGSCLGKGDLNRANEFLLLITKHFKKENTIAKGRIYIANLIYKVTQDIDFTYDWIKDIPQPIEVKEFNMSYSDSIEDFRPLIVLNKLLNICDKGIPVTKAIPNGKPGTDEETLIEFQRMLCLTTQILSEGISNKISTIDIKKTVQPIVRFYYKDYSFRHSYWYKLTQMKGAYFDFLIYSVSKLNKESLNILGDYLTDEFNNYPMYWPTNVQRKIIKSLFENGYNLEKAKGQLTNLESFMLQDKDIDSRIKECTAQAEAWIRLSEKDIAEYWIKQAIGESIGIGYRKDYEFTTWIEWLKEINIVAPNSSSDRIKWFLSHLTHIKETTEGKAFWSASEKLLKTTFDWNFFAGFTQLKWQLNEALIDFDASISIFINSYIELTNTKSEFEGILQLYIEILLFTSESYDTKILRKILEKGYSIFNEEFLRDSLPLLVTAINTKALETSRYSLLIEINDFCESLGISIQDFVPRFKNLSVNKDYNSSEARNTLTLKEGRGQIFEEEVLKRIEDFDSLKVMIQNEDQGNSYFRWTKVLEKVLPTLKLDEVEEIARIAKTERKGSKFFAQLSEAILDYGEKEISLDLANISLEFSSKSGWNRFNDGGTRISAFKALKKIDQKTATDRAFELFCYDLLNGKYAITNIEYLDEILPLLTTDIDIESIWEIIFGYLKRLMSNSNLTKNIPKIELIEKPINETLIDYLLYLIKTPTFIVKEKVILLLTKLIDNGDIYALNEVLNGKLGPGILNDIMMNLVEFDSERIIEFKSTAQQLALSNNYIIRKNARKVLSKLNEKIPIPKSIEPPTSFSIYIPEIKKIEFNKDEDPYYPEIDLNDPRELVRPFGFFVKQLSELSEIEETNLFYRASTIMHEVGNPDEWTINYEKEIRGYLDEISFKYSFPRPRVLAARQAVMYLASELVDSNIIRDNIYLQRLLVLHDYKVANFSIISKPDFIQILKENKFRGVKNDWLDRINDSTRLKESLITFENRRKVIGEYSLVRSLDWGSPTETYMSRISTEKDIDYDYIFGSGFHILTEYYYQIKGISDKHIIIRDQRFDQFSIRSTWIAINPDLARYLGWEPEPTKLFGWKNKDGKLMIESIYWLNGNVNMIPPKDCETGEGWFVLISEEGLNQIMRHESHLFIQKKIIRSKYEDSKYFEKSVNSIIEL